MVANMNQLEKTLDLFSLFPARRIFEDTNRDGYPDRLGLVIEVDPRLADASIWAQVLNLTARLAIEVTALDLPLVRPLRSAVAFGSGRSAGPCRAAS